MMSDKDNDKQSAYCTVWANETRTKKTNTKQKMIKLTRLVLYCVTLNCWVTRSCIEFALAEQPQQTFQNTLPSFNTVNEAAQLCITLWYVNSLQEGTNALTKLSDSLSSQYYHEMPEDDVEGWIVTNDSNGTIYVLFRSFEDTHLQEWLMNLDAVSAPLGSQEEGVRGSTTSEMQSLDVEVHSGWNNAIFNRYNNTSVYEDILSTLKTLLDVGIYNNILCIGHSQGGVLSTILATYLAATDMADQQIQVITYGAPAPGNEAYRTYTNSLTNLAIWRLVNLGDPVPYMSSYWHAGHTVMLSPTSEGEADFKVYYLQYGNDTLGLAAEPNSWTGEFE